MRRRTFLQLASSLTAWAWAMRTHAKDEVVELLTLVESERELAFQQANPQLLQEQQSREQSPQRPRRSRGPEKEPGPRLRIAVPSSSSFPMPSPLRLKIQFEPEPGSKVVPDSFRLYYGLLRIDLTERVRKVALVTPEGVEIQNASLPPGTHRFIAQVSDDRGAIAQQAFQFQISK